MNLKKSIYCVSSILLILITTPASADALHSKIAFNTGIGKKTVDQPADGVKVAYQVKLQGGELADCSADITESLHGRDGGSWGLFNITGDINCSSGGFTYTSAGAWDGKGFHAAGVITKGSGHGKYKGIAGRVAQLGGTAAPAAAEDGSMDVSYELAIDKARD